MESRGAWSSRDVSVSSLGPPKRSFAAAGAPPAGAAARPPAPGHLDAFRTHSAHEEPEASSGQMRLWASASLVRSYTNLENKWQNLALCAQVKDVTKQNWAELCHLVSPTVALPTKVRHPHDYLIVVKQVWYHNNWP